MKITAENVDKLTPEAQDELLMKLFNALSTLDPDIKLNLLKVTIQEFDELDGEDAFGTEGWRHSILGED